jgi:hypothetical protein
LDYISRKFSILQDIILAGAGTQTAGLAFGGTTPAGADKVQQKNTMVLLGQQEELWLQQEDI